MSGAPGRYALIIGNGRSGTNWLLTMLDASRQTHCRNEPQEIPRSPYHQLPDPPLTGETCEVMAQRWDAFVTWTAQRMGERDLYRGHPKDYLHPWSQQLGLASLPLRPKLQRLLRPVSPTLQRGEWRMPTWIGSQARLNQALAVLKINDLKAWTAAWLFQHRPQVPVIHIIRHPGGQLNSGIKRFFTTLSAAEQAAERRLYQGILRQAVQLYPDWAAIVGDIEAMSLLEAVAWFWRLNNELIYQAGQSADSYLPIVYEDLVQDPLAYAREVYRRCQLPWTQAIETRICQGLGVSVWGKLDQSPTAIATAWQRQLAPEYQALAQRVLVGSAMASWW